MQVRKIANLKDVGQAIIDLEISMKVREENIKLQVAEVKEASKPKNLFSNSFTYLAETPEIKKILVNTAVGFLLGYAAKKSAQLLSEETLNRTTENFVKYHLNNIERNKPDSFLTKALSIFRKVTPQTSKLYPYVKY